MDTKKQSNFRKIKVSDYTLGASVLQGYMRFMISFPGEESCTLRVFEGKEEKPFYELEMDKSFKTGAVFAVEIDMNDMPQGNITYDYICGGKRYIDPYAKRIAGRDSFGRSGDARGVVCATAKDTDSITNGNLSHPELKKTELIIYKLHVRGFTAHESSKVKNPGTFKGLLQKKDYIKKLGVNALLLMPCYDFDEIIVDNRRIYGIPENMPKELEESINKVQETTRVNYWGYGCEAAYFAPKASYASEPEKVCEEFKEVIEAFHKQGIEIYMEMFFDEQTPAGFVTDVLRYWSVQYGVDGFRINDCYVRAAKQEPFLEGIKLFSMSGTDGSFEYNKGFEEAARRFLKGDEGQVQGFTERFFKAPDFNGVVNYVTDHEGFTLMDLYSYDIRHNGANGEGNHDGIEINNSWNCGEEGATKKTKIKQLRYLMMRNAMTTLFMSKGTPMLLAGDEFLNSQDGNNNVYCQDNATGWLIWNKNADAKRFTAFVKELIEFRKSGMLYASKSQNGQDISYHGVQAWKPDFSHYSRMIAYMIRGQKNYYLIFNMYWQEQLFEMPTTAKKCEWKLTLTTASESENADLLKISEDGIEVPARTIMLFEEGKQD